MLFLYSTGLHLLHFAVFILSLYIVHLSPVLCRPFYGLLLMVFISSSPYLIYNILQVSNFQKIPRIQGAEFHNGPVTKLKSHGPSLSSLLVAIWLKTSALEITGTAETCSYSNILKFSTIRTVINIFHVSHRAVLSYLINCFFAWVVVFPSCCNNTMWRDVKQVLNFRSYLALRWDSRETQHSISNCLL
jgi:hypothetical protein